MMTAFEEESERLFQCLARNWSRPSFSYRILLARDQPVFYLQLIHLQSVLTGESRAERKQSAILDMDTVTTMNLRWKQFRTKPLGVVSRTRRREFYCLTFKISDFV